MDIMIVCQDCRGSGYRVRIYGFSSVTKGNADILVPRSCSLCSGSGRLLISGWSAKD
mgnify:CR=1 FL=1